jgi:uncharacterized protein (DUF1015 family)
MTSDPADVEFLLELVRRLKDILKSHLDRDVSVSEIVSGSEPVWLCARELEDLREQVREGVIAQESSYDLARENATLEYRLNVVTGTVDVPEEEQLEIIKRWIADGGA